jgi:hypothetical protein
MGENLFQLYFGQGINNQHIQGGQTLNSPEINNPKKKMDK